jgi:hypothetical protein
MAVELAHLDQRNSTEIRAAGGMNDVLMEILNNMESLGILTTLGGKVHHCAADARERPCCCCMRRQKAQRNYTTLPCLHMADCWWCGVDAFILQAYDANGGARR